MNGMHQRGEDHHRHHYHHMGLALFGMLPGARLIILAAILFLLK